MSPVRPIDVCQGLLIGLLAAGIAQAAAPMSAAKGKYFSGFGVCAPYHKNLKDEAGTDVPIDKAWRAMMMGNSARDPFWRMVIRGEVLANPSLRSIIEDKCSTCHMPMARTTAAAEGGKGAVLEQGFADPDHALHEQSALDSLGRLALLSVAVKALQQQLGLANPDGDFGPSTCVALHTLQRTWPDRPARTEFSRRSCTTPRAGSSSRASACRCRSVPDRDGRGIGERRGGGFRTAKSGHDRGNIQ